MAHIPTETMETCSKTKCSLCHLEGHNRRTCSTMTCAPKPKTKTKCSLCHQEGHNRRSCLEKEDMPPQKEEIPKEEVQETQKEETQETQELQESQKEESQKEQEDVKIDINPIPQEKMSMEAYTTTITTVAAVAKDIDVKREGCDGRIDSAIKEVPFLEELKLRLLELHPSWDVVISPPRASCDLMVQGIRINLKLTDCKSADNSVNKPSIFYSITGDTTYPFSSTWNQFYQRLRDAKHRIKTTRYQPTEYHYLVKNKLTGDVLMKPIFDIHTYMSNPSNDLQINWKHEFAHLEYRTEEADYVKKVESLMKCIQKSVREMIERTHDFAYADMEELFP